MFQAAGEDLLVVGGGVAGSTCAVELKRCETLQYVILGCWVLIPHIAPQLVS